MPGRMLTGLKQARGVAYATLDSPVKALEVTGQQPITTNDPYFTTDPKNIDKQWYLEKTQVPEAWNYSQGSNLVTVAILDTGVHATHLDLNDGRVIAGYNTIKQEAIIANTNSDDNGHGTLVAGVIGAVPNNGLGVAGINWSVKLMPVKVLDSAGNGTISYISSGIIWASDHGANIINMSLGGSGFGEDPTLAAAVSYAFNKGVILVSAAGNDLANQGKNLDQTPAYPVCADNGQNMIIGVAASDSNDVKAAFSDFGINCVDITAPGVRILSTAFLPSQPSDNLLIYGDGTSLAAPIVSGIAALVKASKPSYNNIQIRDLILSSTDSILAMNQNNCLGSSCNGFLGKGRINALKALLPRPLADGTLIRDPATGRVYLISNNTKQSVSTFVLNQRGYMVNQITDDTLNLLANVGSGPVLPPLDDTLIKSVSGPTVYIINGGAKRPLTYAVFVSRGFSFSKVNTLSDAEVQSLPTGEWYWPPDRTAVLINGNPTVYVMDQGVVRPVTYFVFTQRKLSFANVIKISMDDFGHLPKPSDSFWLAPPEGTLLKSKTDPTIYVIENGSRRGLSGSIFAARKYKFKDVKVLPQAEVDTIANGGPLA
jgi:subtilisin family serine protease